MDESSKIAPIHSATTNMNSCLVLLRIAMSIASSYPYAIIKLHVYACNYYIHLLFDFETRSYYVVYIYRMCQNYGLHKAQKQIKII